MPVSVFDLFKIGIGPSSSHTVGPMKAANRFIQTLAEQGGMSALAEIRVGLFGSLALTGHGHGTDRAVILGLLGETPEDVSIDAMPTLVGNVRTTRRLPVAGGPIIDFDPERHIAFHRSETLPLHPNGLHFEALDADGSLLVDAEFYSIGGGFVVTAEDFGQTAPQPRSSPFPYRSAHELLALAASHNLSLAELAHANEAAQRSTGDIEAGLRRIWAVMQDCVRRGLALDGNLPGGLDTRRRAPQLRRRLEEQNRLRDPLEALEWVNAFAMAVGEENATGGRIVTAPTNGAAGIIPAVLHYLIRFVPDTGEDDVFTFLLVAAAIGSLYKENASISGAEVGCQGEVGVACSMAAAGLAAALGGSNEQIENAAEIGMEHHLGLTCDPVGGLVQVPCIERNAIAASTAINAARLSLSGDGRHVVSLDVVIDTMRQTGADMQAKYKETSLGGLAVNQAKC
ncbi:L-serine ammonia-lyase [Telmatospirillum sp.]|uniref:L-serine ammonia-lyase n=1 Tax=Telmatospirillum sp. TaxID=2079197 RepID=UPI00283CAF0F|nr:L-serine ammonia-lyase [Telmatospirillum sp.]MDR3439774.1 L-serine ammonia-lyase [Telmatospirillum sp.]